MMAFDIKKFMNEESKKEVIDDFPIKKISVKKLHPSKQNFYNIDPKEIEALKDTIELVGVQENLVVREIKEGEFAGEYEIIVGHKRHLAVSELAAEGKVTEFVPCKIDYSGNSALRELILIFTNSTQRERSDYEKMHEIQRVRELLEDYAKNNDLPGRKRDIIAGILNTSKSTISRLDNIRRHIIPEFMQEYKAGKIPTATANEIAGISDEGQQELWQQYRETGSIKKKEAAAVKQEEKPQPEAKEETQTQPEEREEKPEQIKQEEPRQEEPENIPEQEPQEETTVTVTRTQDNTDRKMLIIAGRINQNKEYNGMNIKYFMDAVTNSDLFDTEFWEKWQNPDIHQPSLLTEYAGVIETFSSGTGELCECSFNEGFTVTRQEAHQTANITLMELVELIDALIYTKVIEIKTERVDVAYWGKETARELARLSMWLTEQELAVMQDIALKLKERAGE
jgi:Predicted transcriptional regulators